MSLINREESIAVLTRMKESRTKCQCSRDKVIEAAAFSMCIKALEMMPAVMPEAKDVPEKET